jgi:hypothetical protein
MNAKEMHQDFGAFALRSERLFSVDGHILLLRSKQSVRS